MQPTERYVQRPDAQLYTQATGRPANGTILLLMGATASMAWWPKEFIEVLAEAGFRIIWYDHRDTGRSSLCSPGEPAYDLSVLTEDVVAILDAYEASAAHLVGMSLGGLIAQIIAIEHPKRVETVTLFAAEPLGNTYEGEGMPAEIMQHFASMEKLDWTKRPAVTEFLLKIAELSAASGRPFDRDAALDRIDRELNHTLSIQHAFNHAMLAGDVGDELKAQNVTQPMLVIHGKADPLISVAAAEKTASLAPRAELVVLDNVGHEFTPAEVQPLSEAIIHFIGAHQAPVQPF